MLQLEFIGVVAAALLILWAAWQDFLTWKIRNATVLALIAVYGVMAVGRYWWAYRSAGDLADMHSIVLGDLAAALLLFAIGFVLWMFRLFGAGDAKLLFPIGLFVGFNNLMLFAVILLLGAIVVMLALKIRIPVQYHAYPYVARLEEIRSTGKIPYGVLLAVAALVAIYVRFVSS